MKINDTEIDTNAVNERAKRIREDKHFKEQLKRVLKPLRMVMGTREAPVDLDQIEWDASLGVALIEAQVAAGSTNPPPVSGLVMVTYNPASGYDLWVRASTVYDLHMTRREKPRPA